MTKEMGQQDKQYNDQRNGTKGQTTIYNTLHRKLKLEEHESN
jgi:hypothetical protein